MNGILLMIFAALIIILPTSLAISPIILARTIKAKLLYLSISPFIFFLTYLLVAAILSTYAQRGILPCKLLRSTNNKTYALRKIYGFCWTSIYYFTPLYWIVLSFPLLKHLTFRLFGYKHNTNFIAYPDTWIRDLPILSFGEGSYLSNRSTIGTNICLSNGHILVDRITVGNGALVGHLAMIAPGVTIGNKSEIGVGTAIGIRVKVEEQSKIGGCCAINHGVTIGEHCEIGTMTYVGVKATIKSNIKIPPASHIPSGMTIHSKEELELYITKETNDLQNFKERLIQIFNSKSDSLSTSLSEVETNELQNNPA